jgi:hypothetical protein
MSESPVDTPPASSSSSYSITWIYSISGILSILMWLVFSYGAAKLSYDKYRSIAWAVLDFFFSYFYYPYYALVLNSPAQVMVAAARRR